MPTASKILVVCVLLVCFGFVWLATSVLEARKQWDLKVKVKAAEVVKTDKDIDAMVYGTEEFREEFKKTVAEPVLALGSEVARTEFKSKFDGGYDVRSAFEAAMNLFVDKNIVDTFQDSVKELNDIQKAPIPDEIQLEAAVKAFDAAERDMAAALKNLDDAYLIFLGQAPGQGGVRAIAGKGMSIDALRQTVVHFRQIIYAQRAVFNIMLSDGEKNKTRIQDLWQETLADAKTMQDAAANGERERDDRIKEVEDLNVKKAKELMDLATEEEKRDKVIAELADLNKKFDEVKARTQLLAKRVREFEIRIDAMRGIRTPVLTADGRVPKGKIQKVNDQEGTAEINIGASVGVKSGVQLHVYRLEPEAKYLGIMEVIKYESDSAVGRMLPQYRQLTIQPGDNVTPEITKPESN
jgi:hypothetical protein